jgi:hypothetical protein
MTAYMAGSAFYSIVKFTPTIITCIKGNIIRWMRTVVSCLFSASSYCATAVVVVAPVATSWVHRRLLLVALRGWRWGRGGVSVVTPTVVASTVVASTVLLVATGRRDLIRIALLIIGRFVVWVGRLVVLGVEVGLSPRRRRWRCLVACGWRITAQRSKLDLFELFVQRILQASERRRHACCRRRLGRGDILGHKPPLPNVL